MAIDGWFAARTADVSLGGQAERVVRVLARAPEFASYASGREVAERAGVNVSTVVRTAQQLGFDGWPDLRLALRSAYLSSAMSDDRQSPDSTDAAALMLRKDALNVTAASGVDNVEAIRAVARAIRAARRTVVVASGSGSGPAHILAYLASASGLDVRVADGPATTQVVQVAQLEPEDCLVVINVWRLTRTLRGITRLGRERGATVVVLTDLLSSPLSADADFVVSTPIEGIDQTPSLTATVAVVQAILAELSRSTPRHVSGRIEEAWNRLDLMDDQV